MPKMTKKAKKKQKKIFQIAKITIQKKVENNISKKNAKKKQKCKKKDAKKVFLLPFFAVIVTKA